jgi:hypothetical protein
VSPPTDAVEDALVADVLGDDYDELARGLSSIR